MYRSSFSLAKGGFGSVVGVDYSHAFIDTAKRMRDEVREEEEKKRGEGRGEEEGEERERGEEGSIF